MPEISRFYGIVVGIFYNDHNPPHFHVKYQKFHGKIAIRDLRLIEGELPQMALRLVFEWAALHQLELLEDWKLAREKKPLKPINPLE